RHEQVMSASGLADTGHSGKALKHILETLPRDELFQASSGELQRVASGILGLQERVRSRLFLRRDHYGRFYSVLAYVPRDRYNTEVRLRVEAMLKEVLGADHGDTSVSLGESPLAQLHLLVRPRSGEAEAVDEGALQARLSEIVRNWQDDLREALIEAHGEARGLADRKSTRLNSSHVKISYAVFCLKKKNEGICYHMVGAAVVGPIAGARIHSRRELWAPLIDRTETSGAVHHGCRERSVDWPVAGCA